jgi:co-chaperonin GroES (HSP10)
MIISPFGTRLIVKRLIPNETKSGIILTKETAQKSLVGEVIHAGPSAEFVKEGELILFAKYSGAELHRDGNYVGDDYNDCLIMNEEDILGRLLPPAEEKGEANAA